MGWKFWKSEPEQSDAQRLVQELNEASYAAAPAPPPSATDPGVPGFSLTVEDVFTITGRGTVVTGTVASGSLTVGEKVRFTDSSGESRETTVRGIEARRRMLETATAGQSIGLLLEKVRRDDVGRGTLIVR